MPGETKKMGVPLKKVVYVAIVILAASALSFEVYKLVAHTRNGNEKDRGLKVETEYDAKLLEQLEITTSPENRLIGSFSSDEEVKKLVLWLFHLLNVFHDRRDTARKLSSTLRLLSGRLSDNNSNAKTFSYFLADWIKAASEEKNEKLFKIFIVDIFKEILSIQRHITDPTPLVNGQVAK